VGAARIGGRAALRQDPRRASALVLSVGVMYFGRMLRFIGNAF